jgi:hypothetical protein
MAVKTTDYLGSHSLDGHCQTSHALSCQAASLLILFGHTRGGEAGLG